MGRRGEQAEEETMSERRRGEEGGHTHTHTHLQKGFSEVVVVEEGRDVGGG